MSDQAWVVGYTEGGDYESGPDDTPLAVCLSEDRANSLQLENEAYDIKLNAVLAICGEQIETWVEVNPRIIPSQPNYLEVPKMPQKTKNNPVREADRVRIRAEINRIHAQNQKISQEHHAVWNTWYFSWKAEVARLFQEAGLNAEEVATALKYASSPSHFQKIERTHYIIPLPIK